MKKFLSLVVAASAAALSMPAMADDLKPVTIAVGTSVLNVGYPMLTLPVTLGYWEEEGYKVSVEPVGASLQAIQQMVAGNADFAQVNGSVIVQSNVANKIPVRVVTQNGVIDWSIAVPEDSAIKGPKDIKGKTIGIFSLATGGLPLMKSYLIENGVDPDKEVDIVPLGLGAAPVEALRTGKVDGLLYWASATAGFENAGLKLRKIVPEDWVNYPDYSLSTLEGSIKKDPDMVIGIARGVAKASIFALENPECAVKLHWQKYPETKPKGADEATLLQWDLNNINAQLGSLAAGYKLNGGKLWGATDPAGFERLQAFLLKAGIIKGEMDAKDYLTDIPDFYEKVNDFDVDAIKAAAQKCEVSG